MNVVWLRLIYIFEFLVALTAVYTTWSEVGGQAHLDLMSWYWKGLLGVGLSWAIVRLTAAIVERERVWNRRSVLWLACVLAFLVMIGLATYDSHLRESQDDVDQEETTTATLVLDTRPRDAA
jgi:cell division protein FtsW (lipid II flippase)